MTDPVAIPLPGGGALRGAVAVPDGDGPFPGVVVLHETFGLNDDMRRIAERFAANGYVALAPDLFSHGNKALCLSRLLLAGASSDAMETTLADVEAARGALAARDDVDGDRLAVAGFCMGGGFALVFGTRGGVRAAGVHYGAVPKSTDALREVCPVVASYGGRDRIFLDDAKRLKARLAEVGVAHDVHVYDGVGHSFMSYDNGPAWTLRIPSPMHVGYSEPEAEDAWRRMLAFFDTHVVAA
ncbi:MAG TPA: dienelactone hydrolase family protein [Acidimicrobiales bacterium]